MILKDCTDIKIDNKSVERIRMFNEIVWEKVQATKTTLAISPSVKEGNYYTVTKNNTFTLIATVELLKNNSTIQEGTIIFSDGSKEYIREIKNGKAELSLTAIHPETKTYTATFQQTKRYKESTSNIEVQIKKDKPILQIWGETKVYDGWKVGVKMTASDGVTPLSNKSFNICANGIRYGEWRGDDNEKITNDKGIVSLSINTLVVNRNYDVYFEFPGDEEYEDVHITQTYFVKPQETVELAIVGYDPGYKDSEKHYQKWDRNGNTFSCYKKNQICYQSSDTIGTYSGTYNHPSPLKVYFSPVTIKNVTKMTLKFNSNQQPGCNGSYGGALFNDPPAIRLSLDGVNFPPPNTDAVAIAFPKREYYNGYFASTGPISQHLEWDYTTASSQGILVYTNQVSVVFYYPQSHGVEEGFLTLYDMKLIVSYFPPQETNFGDN